MAAETLTDSPGLTGVPDLISSIKSSIGSLTGSGAEAAANGAEAAATLDAGSLAVTILIVLGCSLVMLMLGRKLRIPAIICYFIAGIIIGPYCFGIISSQAQIQILADLGVILLMFTIGLEIPLKNLLAMKKIVLIGGTLQLVLTAGVVTGVLLAFGWAFNVALFIGFLVAHSSTAIIMTLYQKSGENDKRHGKIALGLLIFQDLNVVPMMLLVPFLSPSASGDIVTSIIKLVIGLGGLAIILIAAIYLVPRILRHVALTRSGELFIIAIVVLALGVAVVMQQVGVELSLGAFLAGVAISGTSYNHEVLGQVSPLRDLLTSFFFVSIGMMLNLQLVWSNIGIIFGLAALLLLFKIGINFISVKALKTPTSVALLSAVGLASIGEFSFILGSVGVANNILTPEIYQMFLAITILTMAATPFLVSLAPKFVNKFCKTKDPEPTDVEVPDEDHIIIVGYGLTGQYVASALEKLHIRYLVLETNTQTVARESEKGVPIIFGDATREAVLEFAELNKASSIVITLPQPEIIKTVVTVVRRINPYITIITRSRFISDTAELYKLGADSVIVDERECALEMFKRAMASRDVQQETIDTMIAGMKDKLYDEYVLPSVLAANGGGKKAKNPNSPIQQVDRLLSKEMSDIQWIMVEKGSAACGKTLSELNFRKDFGISVLAIKHPGNKGSEVSPRSNVMLAGGDKLIVMCDSKDGLEKLRKVLTASANT